MKRFLLLLFPLLLLSCSREYDNTISMTPEDCQNETAFCNYLADTLNAYITERTEWAIDDRTSPFSKHYYKMFYEHFFESDCGKLASLNNLLCANGLAADSIKSFVNKHIDVYNTYHRDDTLSYVVINDYPEDLSMNTKVLDSMDSLTKWEFIDFFLMFYGLLALALMKLFPPLLFLLYVLANFVCWPIGYAIGFFILRPLRLVFGIEADREVCKNITNVLKILVSAITCLLLLWFCIKYSISLHSSLIEFYSEYIINQIMI